MINVILQDNSAHLATKYGVLNQADFNLIFENLDATKSPTLDYFDLVEPHRDLHGLLVGAGQISTEYNKTKYLADALKHDPAGLHAIEIFYRSFP
jgi:hypothetical protein